LICIARLGHRDAVRVDRPAEGRHGASFFLGQAAALHLGAQERLHALGVGRRQSRLHAIEAVIVFFRIRAEHR
jgi:hypothetical protein